MKKNKAFDCVELQHRGAKKIYEETKGMTVEQELAYWNRKSEALASRQGKTIRRP